MRREVPTERVFFAVVLGVSLLLLSFAMLRSDIASPAHSTRTFRDGFIVADRVTRRTETASPMDAVLVEAVSKNGASTTQRKSADGEKAGGAPVPVPAAAAAIHVSGGDAHTTTIKMEDGDEITIKRAGTSKNKITTISTHEDGKITIENRDKTKDSAAAATADDGETATAKHKGASESDTAVAATSIKKDQPAAVQDSDNTAAKTRAVDFVGAYEEKDGDADFADAGADEDAVALATAAAVADDDEEEELAEKAGDNTHEIVMGKKKVTVVNVGRSQTKVSLSNVDDEDDNADEQVQRRTSGR